MSMKSRFLSLSMREQICITIIFLTIFSVLVILSIAGSLIYEVLKEDYLIKKQFFYKRYKSFIESCFFYQNYCLLKYEEIIKRIQKQIWEYNRMSTNFHDAFKYENFKYNFINNPVINIRNTHAEKTPDDINDDLYYLCFNEHNYNNSYFYDNILEFLNFDFDYTNNNIPYCDIINISLNVIYEGLSSLIFTHNIEKAFHLVEFDEPIMTAPLFVNVNESNMFSFNSSRIYEIVNSLFGNISKFNDQTFYGHFNNLVSQRMDAIMNLFLKYLYKQFFLFDLVYEKAIVEIKQFDEYFQFNINDINTIYNLVRATCGFYSSINYANSKFTLISYDAKGYTYYETTIIDNYLYFIHNMLSEHLNISFIPLYAENDTIISPELCLSLLLKQLNYQVDENKTNELYNKIIKGNSTIKSCFINKDVFEKELEIYDLFIIDNFTHFLYTYTIINQGLINTDNVPYYFIKYTYPNIVSLLDFNSDYILLNQVNFYLFVPFKEPMEFSYCIFLVYRNRFLLIVIIIIYTWIILLAINIIIFYKIINKLKEKKKKLQEAIESSSIKDENIFKYEYDEFINELFITSKELLTGQIDKNRNDKGLDQFNILSIPKDKQKSIDKNIYQRNLIINRDIMTQLIDEQQNMMDFSKYIKINEEFDGVKLIGDLNNDNNDDNDDSSYISEIREEEENKNENINKKNNLEDINKIKENKIREEIEDKEPYKKLFRIAEYLNYYQNKKEENIIHIINNEVKDESKKSNISKLNNNTTTNTLTMNSKLKKSIKGDILGKNDENISINMLDNKNITYLWYMVEKKKENKSLTYYIGQNYDVLFMDDNNYIKYQHDYIENSKLSKDKKKKKNKK